MAKVNLPDRFFNYLITQMLGALNDNFFKMLLQLYVIQILVAKHSQEIISQATLLFTIPFVLFGPWSGYLADRYSKSQVMKVVKFAEIGVMLLGALAFYLSDLNIMLAVLFLMATQSTFFSPAKYGYIPENCSPRSVTSANSWVEMTTFAAIILGTAIVGPLLTAYDDNGLVLAFYSVGFAILGSIAVTFIQKVPAVGTQEKFPWNPIAGIWKDLTFLKRQKHLFLAALANSYFWLIGLIYQTNILIYGKNMIADEANGNIKLSVLPVFIGVGVALGSLLASRWSGKKVELGLVPVGGFGMAFTGIALYFSTHSYEAASLILFFTGVFGGLFIVPLYAYLQTYSNEKERGRVLATSGILNGLFLVLGALIYRVLAVDLALAPEVIYLITGIATIGAIVYICMVIPEYFIRFIFWLITHALYRIRIVGEENIPLKKAALLAPNHVTYIDSFLIGSTMQRFIRFIMHKDFYDIPFIKFMFRIMKCIPIDPAAGRESVTDSLQKSRNELLNHHVVCIYPEGKLTRDGKMNDFRPGLESVVKDTAAPIIPVYMHNLWGSIFSFEGGKAIVKLPRQLFRKITIHFGEPLPSTATAAEVESAVKSLQSQWQG